MRHVARKSLITMAAAGGLLVAAGGHAQADSGAEGGAQDSPGVGSGNTVQAPINVPVNVCGNTVDVGGLLNPASGNSCTNEDGDQGSGESGGAPGDGAQGGGAAAEGQAQKSPGVLSGNTVQAPVHAPVNVCGNTATVGGAGNAVTGNECENVSDEAPPSPAPEEPPAEPEEPGEPEEPDAPGPADEVDSPEVPGDRAQAAPRPEAQTSTPAGAEERLAETGGGVPLEFVLPLSGGLLLGGALLYRRSRATAGV